MTLQLEKILWSTESKFLLNMLDPGNIDHHFYAGSLVAAAFQTLSNEKSRQLIATAEKELLDPQLGIRNAMPADFHELGGLYHFQGMEMGEPYIYINGGVWPQGTIWYGLALLTHGQTNRSLEVLKKYLTLDGISQSPSGQPSFYEYRNADVNSSNYGQIDKPTFLWAGGLYLYYLYQLMGMKENPYHITVQSDIPDAFTHLRYQVLIAGKSCQLEWRGRGHYFKEINWDDVPTNSAIVFKPVEKISIIRGFPSLPYLAELNGRVKQVDYHSGDKKLTIQLKNWKGKSLDFLIISPFEMKKVSIDNKDLLGNIELQREEQVFKYRVQAGRAEAIDQIVCQF
jgi:hypothetical protein